MQIDFVYNEYKWCITRLVILFKKYSWGTCCLIGDWVSSWHYFQDERMGSLCKNLFSPQPFTFSLGWYFYVLRSDRPSYLGINVWRIKPPSSLLPSCHWSHSSYWPGRWSLFGTTYTIGLRSCSGQATFICSCWVHGICSLPIFWTNIHRTDCQARDDFLFYLIPTRTRMIITFSYTPINAWLRSAIRSSTSSMPRA